MIQHTARRGPEGKHTIIVTAQTIFGVKEMELKCTPMQYVLGAEEYKKGALMQNAFPFLSAEEREFLISGTTPEEWDKISQG